ncbi:MAG: acyl-CoA thioesterase [Proteobacteria bacterium]|nr:acyl-CoA thioesterase [Pseudomonadota bacterium]
MKVIPAQKHPQASEVTMSEMVMSQHINGVGTVFGGVVLSWADIAAAISAQKFAENMVVTASIDGMHFLHPIKIGWIVSIVAKVNRSRRTSCEVGVKITSMDPITQVSYHNCTGYFTMVAIDKKGKPTAIPTLVPVTKEDRRRYQAAALRQQSRIELYKKQKAKDTTTHA